MEGLVNKRDDKAMGEGIQNLPVVTFGWQTNALKRVKIHGFQSAPWP
jgi:hypothetical protein